MPPNPEFFLLPSGAGLYDVCTASGIPGRFIPRGYGIRHLALRGRGYGLKGRTAFSIYRFTKRDKVLLVWFGVLAAVSLYGCSRGAAFAEYNPRILLAGFVIQGHTARVSCPVGLTIATFICFGLFCFTPLFLGVVESVSMKRSVSHVGQDMAITYRKIYEIFDGEGELG